MEYLCEQPDLGPRLTYQNDCSPDGEHLYSTGIGTVGSFPQRSRLGKVPAEVLSMLRSTRG